MPKGLVEDELLDFGCTFKNPPGGKDVSDDKFT
jgi:hypothetical protein